MHFTLTWPQNSPKFPGQTFTVLLKLAYYNNENMVTWPHHKPKVYIKIKTLNPLDPNIVHQNLT